MKSIKEELNNNTQAWVSSLLAGLLFIIIASPIMFRLVNTLTSLLGVHISNDIGCPNAIGLIVHGIVFALLIRVFMEIKF